MKNILEALIDLSILAIALCLVPILLVVALVMFPFVWIDTRLDDKDNSGA